MVPHRAVYLIVVAVVEHVRPRQFREAPSVHAELPAAAACGRVAAVARRHRRQVQTAAFRQRFRLRQLRKPGQAVHRQLDRRTAARSATVLRRVSQPEAVLAVRQGRARIKGAPPLAVSADLPALRYHRAAVGRHRWRRQRRRAPVAHRRGRHDGGHRRNVVHLKQHLVPVMRTALADHNVPHIAPVMGQGHRRCHVEALPAAGPGAHFPAPRQDPGPVGRHLGRGPPQHCPGADRLRHGRQIRHLRHVAHRYRHRGPMRRAAAVGRRVAQVMAVLPVCHRCGGRERAVRLAVSAQLPALRYHRAAVGIHSGRRQRERAARANRRGRRDVSEARNVVHRDLHGVAVGRPAAALHHVAQKQPVLAASDDGGKNRDRPRLSVIASLPALTQNRRAVQLQGWRRHRKLSAGTHRLRRCQSAHLRRRVHRDPHCVAVARPACVGSIVAEVMAVLAV